MTTLSTWCATIPTWFISSSALASGNSNQHIFSCIELGKINRCCGWSSSGVCFLQELLANLSWNTACQCCVACQACNTSTSASSGVMSRSIISKSLSNDSRWFAPFCAKKLSRFAPIWCRANYCWKASVTIQVALRSFWRKNALSSTTLEDEWMNEKKCVVSYRTGSNWSRFPSLFSSHTHYLVASSVTFFSFIHDLLV